jgi:hypothetical protein
MFESYLRPLLLLLAGAVAALLIQWGISNRSQTSQVVVPASTPVLTLQRVEPVPTPNQSNETPVPSETVLRAIQKAKSQLAIEPTASPPTTSMQPDGLPLGVQRDAVNLELYKRLGIPPPLIDCDGRDIGQEATQMIQTHREPMPFPGVNPNASATPMPFPQSPEEGNEQAKVYALPSPSPSVQ